jgi:hypothetical protein
MGEAQAQPTADSTTEASAQPQAAPEQPQAEEQVADVQDPGSIPNTEFLGISEALQMGMQTLKQMPQANPARLKMFLINDLYPILVDFAQMANWYTGDLHERVSNIEDEVEGTGGEGISPEFAEQLIEFIGQSLQLFGLLVNLTKGNPEVAHSVQMMIARAPGLIARIQEITLSEEEEEEDEEEDEEDVETPEVLEPRSQMTEEQAAAADAAKAEVAAPEAEESTAPAAPEPETSPSQEAPLVESPAPEAASVAPETEPQQESAPEPPPTEEAAVEQAAPEPTPEPTPEPPAAEVAEQGEEKKNG